MVSLETRREDGVMWVAHRGNDVAGVVRVSPRSSGVRFLSGRATDNLPAWALARWHEVPTEWVVAWLSTQIEAAARQRGRRHA